MRWLVISAAAILSLAATTSAQTAPDPLSGPSSRPQSAPYEQRLALNDQQHKGNKGGGQGPGKPQTIHTNQRPQQQFQRQQTQRNQTVHANPQQRQQFQRQQTQKNRAVRANPQQRQQFQRQQTQKNQAVRANPQQRQQFQRQQTQRNQAVPTNQRQQQQFQRQQAPRSQRYNWSSYQVGHRPPDWNSHRNFDRGVWQRNDQAQRRYHWNSYQRPQGWYYRRWGFGMVLPSLFWGRQYWINSYSDYGLPNPPYGYVWVRYGDDALLVNVESGDILRVTYGLYD